jgi:hypothetical protein
MSKYEKTVKVLEGPWEADTFPQGEETTDVLSRKTITTYVQDGDLCESTTTREYRGDDYFDTSSNKRILKVNV